MRKQEIQTTMLVGTPVVVRSYTINENFYCHIENEDPGAVIARSSGATRKEAVDSAIAKATSRLVSPNLNNYERQ